MVVINILEDPSDGKYCNRFLLNSLIPRFLDPPPPPNAWVLDLAIAVKASYLDLPVVFNVARCNFFQLSVMRVIEVSLFCLFVFSEVQISPSESVTTVMEGEEAMVCVRVSNGSLQRDVQLLIKSLSGPTSTGETCCLLQHALLYYTIAKIIEFHTYFNT